MSGSVSEIRQIHDWFLHRGLPLVLTRRVRSRALIARSAPMPLLMLTVVVYFTGELWQLGRPDDSAKALADNRIPCRGGAEVHDRHSGSAPGSAYLELETGRVNP